MNMNKIMYIIFLYLIFPGVILAWLFMLLPFLIWDSLSEDWWPEFSDDMKQYLEGIKTIKKGE